MAIQSIQMHHIMAQTALNRMGERRRDSEWLKELKTSPNAVIHLLADLKIAIDSSPDRAEAQLRGYSAKQLSDVNINADEACFLGLTDEGVPRFVIGLSPAQLASYPGGEDAFAPLVDLRTLARQGALTPEELTLAAQARALIAWHGTQRCCGRCGARTEARDGGWRRDCWSCGQMHFPRSDPAVIMAITHGDRCLLGHEPRFTENMYSVLAGFIEPGDDIETAVRREIFEEAGIRVGRVEYVASQPWPFPHSLMIGCWGEALNEDFTLDPVEMPEAHWFSREEILQMMAGAHPKGYFVPPPLSISHTLIRAFAEGRLG